jgi:peptidoglycan/LPS O-acetylase OafA/YrhL
VSGGAATFESRDPRLDGLRGLAILLVMLYHLTHHGFARGPLERAFTAIPSLGWSGVDLFFVLSGFLITGILLASRESSSYYRSFYGRRVLRIFPLYYAVLFFFLVLVPLSGVFAHVHDLWSPHVEREGIWYWLFLSNVREAWIGGPEHQALSITWSLAIEEHFYLFWPFVVRRAGERRLLAICAVMIAGSLALRVGLLAAGVSEHAVYVLTPCRLDPLATGAALAVLARRGGLARLSRAANVVLPAALVLFAGLCFAILPSDAPTGVPNPRRYETDVVAALAHLGNPWMQTLGFSLLCVIYGALLVSVVTAPPGAWRSRVFEVAWLRALGKYSYALYLFHFFVGILVLSVFAPAHHLGWFLLAVPFYWALAIGTSFALARLSWAVLEEPMLRLKRFFPYRL